MRVIYDKDTGRVAGIGDALAAGEGQAVADLTPDESKALAETAAAVSELTARLEAAGSAQQDAVAAYAVAADGVRRDFAAAEAEATKAGGRVGFDRKQGVFVTVAAAPAPEPTPEDDEALVLDDPRMAALLRMIQRQLAGKG